MGKYSGFFFAVFVLLILFIASVVAGTLQHENVHKAIFTDYGIKSTVKYSWFRGIFTGTMGVTSAVYDSKECSDSCKLAHEINEVISYNLETLMFSIFGVALFWLITTEIRRTENAARN